MTRKRHNAPRLDDPVLVFFLNHLRSLPPEERRGLNEWCREAGILTPEMQRAIERWEVRFSELGYEPTSD
jgi:hypothetical protein